MTISHCKLTESYYKFGYEFEKKLAHSLLSLCGRNYNSYAK